MMLYAVISEQDDEDAVELIGIASSHEKAVDLIFGEFVGLPDVVTVYTDDEPGRGLYTKEELLEYLARHDWVANVDCRKYHVVATEIDQAFDTNPSFKRYHD